MGWREFKQKVKDHKEEIIYYTCLSIGIVGVGAYGIHTIKNKLNSVRLEKNLNEQIKAIKSKEAAEAAAKRTSELISRFKPIGDIWDVPEVYDLMCGDNNVTDIIINEVKIDQLGKLGEKILECQPDAKEVHMIARICDLVE